MSAESRRFRTLLHIQSGKYQGVELQTLDIPLRRVIVESGRPFDDVVASLFVGIGPLHETISPHAEATSYEDFQRSIESRLGTADLMEFLRLDLGSALRIDPQAKPYRALRIIAGNPLIMKRMLATVPHAGSYAPVTLLVYEQGNTVYMAYDLVATAISRYGSEEATQVAEDLDKKVLRLLQQAATGTNS
jgi:uncharacterized protein (DUF302 family)